MLQVAALWARLFLTRCAQNAGQSMRKITQEKASRFRLWSLGF
jgi:hypothetical protein